MKRLLIFALVIISTNSYSLNTVSQEKGTTGFEVSSFINYISYKDYEENQKYLREKYFYIDSINKNLYKKLKITEFDKNNNYNLSINRFKNDKESTAHNIEFLFDTKINYGWKLGLNLSYVDLSNSKNDLAQGNLFSKWWNEDDYTITTSIYGGGYQKNNKWSEGYGGITNKLEKEYLSFNEVEYIPYLITEYRRLSKHQVFYNELGYEINKTLYEDYENFDKILANSFTLGFGYDVFGRNKKKTNKGKYLSRDDFYGNFFLREELPIRYKLTEISPYIEISKSIISSNLKFSTGMMFKYNF